MADLPDDRLMTDKPSFMNTGVDFFGPFDVKQGRGTVKRYGVLFTCLTLRAVHIEVADSLDTDSCIMQFDVLCAAEDKSQSCIVIMKQTSWQLKES